MFGTRKSPLPLLVLVALPLVAQTGPTVEEAERRMAAKDFSGAVTILRELVQGSPQDPELRKRLALAQARRRRFRESAAELATARALKPDDPSIVFDLASSLTNQGRHAEALPVWQELESMQHLHPIIASRPEIPYHRGQAAAKLDLIPEAVEAMGRAVSMDPQNQRYREHLAGVLLDAGRHDEAISHFETLCKLAPHTANHHYHLGVALMAVERDEEAEVKLREARRLNPKDFQPSLRLARLYGRQKKTDLALTLYLETLEKNPIAAEAFYGLTRHYSAKGSTVEAEEWQKKYDEAKAKEDAANEKLRLLIRGLRERPNDQEKNLAYLELMVGNQQWAQAMDAAMAFVSYCPDSEQAVLNLAALLGRQREFEPALYELDKILERKPDHAFANLESGRAEMAMGRSDRALPFLVRAAKNLPPTDTRYGECIDMAAEAGMRSKRPAETLEILEGACKAMFGRGGDEARMLLRFVQAAEASGQLPRALTALEAAFSHLDPKDPLARQGIEILAKVAESRGEAERARLFRDRLR